MKIVFGDYGVIHKVGGNGVHLWMDIILFRGEYIVIAGEFNVSSFSLVSIQTSDWVSAGLEMLPERFIKVEQGMDPRQAYCAYIFYPGRFQRDVIDKALIVSAGGL